ncbi:hypothetical protein [Streptomyces sp. NRRL F-2890]|uniref:hypothetical protein n=1 Tax=Streptomyces sp. NRRL F-2890 TaxID=1463845 RepID=UPI0004C664ED|nr:hypothetical protein [Streptomyces sp. NRRL F-2890]
MKRSIAVLLGCLAGLGCAGCVSVHPGGGDAAEVTGVTGADGGADGAGGEETAQREAGEQTADRDNLPAPAGEPRPHPVPEPGPQAPGGSGATPAPAAAPSAAETAATAPRPGAGLVPELPDGAGGVPSSWAQACELGKDMIDPGVLDLCRSAGH